MKGGKFNLLLKGRSIRITDEIFNFSTLHGGFGSSREENRQSAEKFFVEELDKIKANKEKEVSFTGKYLGTGQTHRIIEALNQNQSVINFKIEYISISTKEAESIFEFIRQRKNINEIRLLDIEYCNYKKDIAFENLTIFAKLLNGQTTFTFNNFEISLSKIGLQGVQILAPNLINNNFLKQLDLAYNEISDEGAKLIFKALTLSQAIEYIKLYGNKLTDKTAGYAKQFLENNQSIKNIDLFNNQITNEGLKQIAAGLVKNSSIIELRVEGNAIKYKDQDSQQLKYLIENMLKINSYSKNVLNKKQIPKPSKDENLALEIELESINDLKNYLSKNSIPSLLSDLDQQIKFNALHISSTPLNIILKSKKFLPVMNLYLGKTHNDQDQAITETIELFKLNNSNKKQDQAIKFFDCIRIIEQNSLVNEENINFSNEEKNATAIYEQHPEYIDNYLINIDEKSRIDLVKHFMDDDTEKAIQIQQLHKIFGYKLPTEFSSSFDSAILLYLENNGYEICALGDYQFII